jgi:hypothetical protein
MSLIVRRFLLEKSRRVCLTKRFDIPRQNTCASYQNQRCPPAQLFWYLLILQRTTFLLLLLFAIRKLFADSIPAPPHLSVEDGLTTNWREEFV